MSARGFWQTKLFPVRIPWWTNSQQTILWIRSIAIGYCLFWAVCVLWLAEAFTAAHTRWNSQSWTFDTFLSYVYLRKTEYVSQSKFACIQHANHAQLLEIWLAMQTQCGCLCTWKMPNCLKISKQFSCQSWPSCLVFKIKNLEFSDSFKSLGLPSLYYRRARYDPGVEVPTC